MTLTAIQKWQQTARPDANEKDISLALGIFLEEVVEVLEEFENANAPNKYTDLDGACFYVKILALALKNNDLRVKVKDGSRANLTKELADVVVTAVGLGHVLGLDVPTACDRVNRSNWSKFVDGMPLYDSNGKVIKGPDYVPADMTGCYKTNSTNHSSTNA